MPCIWPRQLPFDELRARSYQFIFVIVIRLRATSMVITLPLIGKRIFSRESAVILSITLCEFGISRRRSLLRLKVRMVKEKSIILSPIRRRLRQESKNFIEEIQR